MLTPVVEAHGARIPAIGFGTWPMKGADCVRAVSVALASGYRHIDTAAGYRNEAEVGEAVRASGVARAEIFITTKITPWDLAEGDMQRAAERSVEALGGDAVDLILIHWPSRTIPVADTIRSLNDVQRRGLARHIGISNFTTALLAEAWAATEAPLAAIQCEYHPHLRQEKLLAAARARAMAFIAYAPIGQGAALSEAPVLAAAARHGRTPAQVVLRWLVQQDGVAAIPKSATLARIRENCDVFDFSLTTEEMPALSGLARSDGRIVRDPELAPAWDE
jgi:diketogulonate reductase-like aldo/keto reductase